MDDWLDKMKNKDDYEKRMRKAHCCIVCGVKLEPTIFDGKEHWYKDTCNECRKEIKMERDTDHKAAKRFGAGNKSLHHEGLRRLGYSTYNTGGPDMRKVEERD